MATHTQDRKIKCPHCGWIRTVPACPNCRNVYRDNALSGEVAP